MRPLRQTRSLRIHNVFAAARPGELPCQRQVLQIGKDALRLAVSRWNQPKLRSSVSKREPCSKLLSIRRILQVAPRQQAHTREAAFFVALQLVSRNRAGPESVHAAVHT